MNCKSIFFFFATLLIFTEGLIFFHYSKYETNEFNTICHSQYTEKVWIDACLLPYQSEINTFEIARDIEIVGIVISSVCFIMKLGPTNAIKIKL